MKNFFRLVAANFVALMIFGFVASAIFFLMFIGLVASMTSRFGADTGPKDMRNGSVVTLDLNRRIAESRHQSTNVFDLGSLFRERTMGLRSVLEGIERAGNDTRVSAIFIKGATGETPNSLAALEEVRRALLKAKEAGKPIIAYDVDWTEKEYFVASVADEILVHPDGAFNFDGFASENPFFAEMLQKLGIEMQIVRVGRYKNAAEPFTSDRMSEETREQTFELLNDFWQNFISTVGAARNIEPATLQNIADTRGILTANESLEANVVTAVAFPDEVRHRLSELSRADVKDVPEISLNSYTRLMDGTPVVRAGTKTVGVVYATGQIMDNRTGDSGIIVGDDMAETLRELRFDNNTHAVVLRIDSPGGSAYASELIRRELELLAAAKQVVVSMGPTAASGGYWIASGARTIFAEPYTVTGSIGVIGLLPNIAEASSKIGVNWEQVKTAELADMMSGARRRPDAQIQIIQKSVDVIYESFLQRVAMARGKTRDEVHAIAQGRVWTGRQALELGLVDQLGGLQEAIRFAQQQVDAGANWVIEDYPKPGEFDLFLSLLLPDVEARVGALFPSLLGPQKSALDKILKEYGWALENGAKGSVHARLMQPVTVE